MFALLDREAEASPHLVQLLIPRQRIQHRELRVAMDRLIYSRPEAFALGDDPLVDQLMRAAGFKSIDYIALRFTTAGRQATAIALVNRVWRQPDLRETALLVKQQAAQERTRCILLPQASIGRGIRGRFAIQVSKGRSASLTRRDLDAVLAHVHLARLTTINDCANAIADHSNPQGVVLAMIARGLLDVDRRHALMPSTWVTTPL